ncbi:fap1 adhesin isoform X3 [Prorops nasuta]|uniref:fap1 adhesin isoform X3 n=1 Tax=Prorops nasuta TaxID=863751 RepID=UPI0034CDD440
MSENSKMGLFGSKDENKDLKKESVKKESPERYGPYCLDSDSETYDTEALSIMDINDIIGVQSEPVNDSTFESEIAALSQIITESKVEPSLNSVQVQSLLQTKNVKKVEDSSNDNVSSKDIIDTTIESHHSNEKKIDATLMHSNICSDSSINKDIQMDNTNKNKTWMCGIDNTATSNSSEAVADDNSVKQSENINTNNKACKDEKNIENVTSINKSLQLIGEAYTSEDSQESAENDNKSEEINENQVSTITIEEELDLSKVKTKVMDYAATDNKEFLESSIIKNLEVSDNLEQANNKTETSLIIQKEDNIKNCPVLEYVKNLDDEKTEISTNFIPDLEKSTEKILKDSTVADSMSDKEKTDDAEISKMSAETIKKLEIQDNSELNTLNNTIEDICVSDSANMVSEDVLSSESPLLEKQSISQIEVDTTDKAITIEKMETCESFSINKNNSVDVKSNETNIQCLPVENKENINEPSLKQQAVSTLDHFENVHISNEGGKTVEETSIEIDHNVNKGINMPSTVIESCITTDSDVKETLSQSFTEATRLLKSVDNSSNIESIISLEEAETDTLDEKDDSNSCRSLESKVVTIDENVEEEESHVGVNISCKISDNLSKEIDNIEKEKEVFKVLTMDPEDGKLLLTVDTIETEEIADEEIEAKPQAESKNTSNLKYSLFENKSMAGAENSSENKDLIIDNQSEDHSFTDNTVENSRDDIEKIEETQPQKMTQPFSDSQVTSEDTMAEAVAEINQSEDLESSTIESEMHQIPKTLPVIPLQNLLDPALAYENIKTKEEKEIETGYVKNNIDDSSLLTGMEATIDIQNESKSKNEVFTENKENDKMDAKEPIEKLQDLLDVSSTLTEEIVDTENQLSLSSDSQNMSKTDSEVIEMVESESTEENISIKEESTVKMNSLITEVEDIHSSGNNELQESNLNMDFAENSVISELEDNDSKLDSAQNILSQDRDDSEIGESIEISYPPSSEISELESAVKFLQESEEQAIDTALALSPKLVESVMDNIIEQTSSELFVPSEDICEDANVLVDELGGSVTDSISISEAEIISEAVKLESERKLAEQSKIPKCEVKEVHKELAGAGKSLLDILPQFGTSSGSKTGELPQVSAVSSQDYTLIPKLTERLTKLSEAKVSILEERLREPPKIEIPTTDLMKIDAPTTPKSSLLIPKDSSKMSAYQKMLESPKTSDKTETKSADTPRKDSEKHDLENVGSPRIILKIAKSAIADCSEPRSPKSPKIRSAANSPNPEDSPGQKLGKIKLKLSKSGHPSIISNENFEDTGQWYTESAASLSPIGMKIKFSKTGDPSIISSEKHDFPEDPKEKKVEDGKRTESPIGMKIKLSKTGDASIIQHDFKEATSKHKDKHEIMQGSPKRTESPIGMKIKLSKSGDASIVQPEKQETDVQCIPKRTDSPIGMKIKLSKSGDASIVSSDISEEKESTSQELPKRTDSPLGMKIKLSKTKGCASIITTENLEEARDKLEVPEIPKRTESPLGMKIKLSKTGDASIIHSEVIDEMKEKHKDAHEIYKPESPGVKIKVIKSKDTEGHADSENQDNLPKDSTIGMKFKLSKTGDASIIPSDKPEQGDDNKLTESYQETSKRTESPLGMKIKLSKTGDAAIIQQHETDEKQVRKLESEYSKSDPGGAKERQQKRKDIDCSLEMKIKLSKTGHPTIVTHDEMPDLSLPNKASAKEPALKILKAGHSTIVQSNRSELTIEPIQMQNKQTEAIEMCSKRKEILISPVESKKSKLEAKLSQILPEVTIQPLISKDQKQLLFAPSTSLISRQQMNVINQEISITHVRPSKSGDSSMSEKLKEMLAKNTTNLPIPDCEIIEHRPELIIVNENSNSSQDVMIIEEVPTIRDQAIKMPKKRGRPRRTMVPQMIHTPHQLLIPRDPLALDEIPQLTTGEQRENERPKRTCRNQKSYAPPKRGRGGRGRGKRKIEATDLPGNKKSYIEQDLTAIEMSTIGVININEATASQDSMKKTSELYKALKQPPMSRKGLIAVCKIEKQCIIPAHKDVIRPMDVSIGAEQEIEKSPEIIKSVEANALVPPGHPNWLTPVPKKQIESSNRNEISTIQVIDEETRMSAESGSRSQTPARGIAIPASETIINEESQGSVLSTATTESEKVKVKNRRMEINFDPDEGPFTVDKIAEYEWPLDRKGETFMIQEQISQYLGVKSFKRKYPDLKRRMVDMEERNYLRENQLVSEAMCDMGLTAVCSSEVLDVMCSDFPEQYEEYRKHMREKQVKEHSKRQKELTAAATAEKNRLDLAEMAVQSALSWNINLNKARSETRKCSLDLQTFTIHVPKKQQRIDTESKVSHYPVALIPGQYTDNYREYTPAELRYYPLNTVLYGPMRPNLRKLDSQSEGSQSDSDSDSSSDDSSSSSSEGTQDTEESQSTMDEIDEMVNQKDEIKLKCKMCLKTLNKHGKHEILIQCGTCNGNVHPSCIDLTLDMVSHIQSYAWQCTDCKTCAQCHDPADEANMLFCDMCDRGYHIYCVGLRRVPNVDKWHCQECAVCANCGSREPSGLNSDRSSIAQWQHEFKKGDKNTRVYVSTLCVPCSKMRGDQGNTSRQEKLCM